MRIEILDGAGAVVNTIICDALSDAQALFGDACQLAAEQDVVPVRPRTLTHLEFRRLFTRDEQEACDELERSFESDTNLSPAQKRSLRTGYKNFYSATAVNLDDPDIPPMLDLYVALGLLDADRPAEILS